MALLVYIRILSSNVPFIIFVSFLLGKSSWNFVLLNCINYRLQILLIGLFVFLFEFYVSYVCMSAIYANSFGCNFSNIKTVCIRVRFTILHILSFLKVYNLYYRLCKRSSSQNYSRPPPTSTSHVYDWMLIIYNIKLNLIW